MNPDRLRQLYRQSAAHRADPGPCSLAPEEMLAVLDGSAPPEERLRVLAAIAAQPACKEEFDLLRAVVLAGTPARPGGFRAPWALAAMLLVSVGLGAVFLMRGPDAAPVYRGGAEPVRLAAPVGPIATTGSIALTWHPSPGAWRYEVTVVPESLLTRWRSATADTTVVLPDSALGTATAFRWWVTARLPDGRSVRSASASVQRR